MLTVAAEKREGVVGSGVCDPCALLFWFLCLPLDRLRLLGGTPLSVLTSLERFVANSCFPILVSRDISGFPFCSTDWFCSLCKILFLASVWEVRKFVWLATWLGCAMCSILLADELSRKLVGVGVYTLTGGLIGCSGFWLCCSYTSMD